MTNIEARIAKALAAFRNSDGHSLTTDQYEALIDQMALACSDLSATRSHYANFVVACNEYAEV